MQLKLLFNSLGRPFVLLWLGSTVSLVGTMLLGFALSVWVFQQSGSVLDFSGMLVATALPCLLILPFAGSFADHFDRRYVMILSDSIAAIMTLILALLLWNDILKIWHLYLFNFVASMAGAFQAPAYLAAASAVLQKDQMIRANGLMGASRSILTILTPMAAGALLGVFGLSGIMLLDLMTFCIGTVLVLKAVACMPHVAETIEKPLILGAFKDFSEAISFFKKQRLMLGTLFFVTFQGSLMALVSSMITPLVLANHSALELGWIMTWGGIGGLAGSGMLMVKGGSKRLMTTFLTCNAILSLCILIAGASHSVSLYSICAFFAMLVGTTSNGCSNTLWMRKVPPDCQGRIFALIGTVMTITVPVVAVLGGLAADNYLEPALAPGGALANSIGVWLGTGNGRGLGLVFIFCGLLGMVVSLGALTQAQLRSVDDLVPDGR